MASCRVKEPLLRFRADLNRQSDPLGSVAALLRFVGGGP